MGGNTLSENHHMYLQSKKCKHLLIIAPPFVSVALSSSELACWWSARRASVSEATVTVTVVSDFAAME